MNVRDLHVIHANLLTAMMGWRDADQAYGWTRLLCRQLRTLTLKTDCTGTGEWFDVA